jgi:hypothetical protein
MGIDTLTKKSSDCMLHCHDSWCTFVKSVWSMIGAHL